MVDIKESVNPSHLAFRAQDLCNEIRDRVVQWIGATQRCMISFIIQTAYGDQGHLEFSCTADLFIIPYEGTPAPTHMPANSSG